MIENRETKNRFSATTGGLGSSVVLEVDVGGARDAGVGSSGDGGFSNAASSSSLSLLPSEGTDS